MNPQRKRNVLRRKIAIQGGLCYLCGEPMMLGLHHTDPMAATLDHIIPIADGGRRSSAKNVKAAHRHCNMRRGVEMHQAKRAARRPSHQGT